jgi:hypothetical protein
MKFPIQKYLTVKAELAAAKKILATEKAAWLAIREKVSDEETAELDDEFKMTFDRIGISNQRDEEAYNTLKALTDKGASARTQDDYELGFHNLATFIDYVTYDETDKERIHWALKIIRLALAADASITTQRSYVGNGGAITIEILMGYKTHSMSQISYTILCWILHKDPERRIFQQFLVSLGRTAPSPMDDWFEKAALALIAVGYCPFDRGMGHDYMSPGLFQNTLRWLHIIFPYENEHIKDYISNLKSNVTKEHIEYFMGAVSSSAQNRKKFKEYFSLDRHWLMDYIISDTPEILFSLVKRNEREILMPFVKRYKTAMRALREEFLLAGKDASPKTVQLLTNIGIN